jgi:hypothetical protein
MKKSMLMILVMAFLVCMASSYGFAQVTGIADTSKEGSLLVWPYVKVSDNNETYILMANNDAGGAESDGVFIKCYWEVKSDPTTPASNCFVSDFAFFLSRHNPVIFKASDGTGLDGRGVAAGMGYGTGALKCWAVDPTETKQISWDHLSGSAMILDNNATPINIGEKTAFQYNAWRFAANVLYADDNTSADGFQVGKVTDFSDTGFNQLTLSGLSTAGKPKFIPTGVSCVEPYDQAQCKSFTQFWKYDACPKYLTFDFLGEYKAGAQPSLDTGYAKNLLALVPCKEDLRDAEYDLATTLTYTIWNENEVKYTGSFQCSNCDYEMALANLKNSSNLNMFLSTNLHTASGRFRVEGLKNTSKCSGSVATPLVGIIASQIVRGNTSSNLASRDMVATNGTGGGSQTDDDLAGFIKWVPTGLPEKAHK